MADWSAALTTPRMLGIALTTGVITLVVAAFLLGRTQWMQRRPIATCAALSILAHLLLVLIAWMTHLYDAPRPPGGGPIRLSIATEDQPGGEETESPADPPLNEFPVPTSASSLTELWDQVPQTLAQSARSDMQPVPDVPPPSVVSDTEKPAVERTPSTEPPSEPPAAQAANPDAAANLAESAPATAPTSEDSSKPAESANRAHDTNDSNQPPAPTDPAVPATSTAAASTSADTAEQTPTPSASPSPIATDETWKPSEHAPAVPKLRNGKPVPEAYRLRLTANRLQTALDRGGTADTEAAVDAALVWLAAAQSPDGRWDASAHEAGQERIIDGQHRGNAGAQADHAMTGLALLTLLGAGHTHLEGKYRESVQHGLEYLMRGQDPDGNVAGDTNPYARMYCHGIATFALSEAFAMTGDERLASCVERAIGYTIHSQDPYGGGWRYSPQARGDTSQFGWQVLALTSAQHAGIPLRVETRAGMERFLRSVSSGRYSGLASYQPNFPPTRAMTAEALACRIFLCTQHGSATVDEATRFVSEELPGMGRINLYYWYYATLALAQRNDDRWRQWNQAMQKQLLSTQRTDGVMAGSWDPRCIWGGHGGRVYSTALSAMCLEVYYRYLPAYQRERF